MLKAFIRCEAGATAIEYVMIAGAVFLVIILAVQSMGETTRGRFESVAAGFRN
jgi:Flp pilus assembly pilin Flp